MTATKLDNFKVVAGVMNNTKLSEDEERILQELRAGELLEPGGSDQGREDEPIMIGNDDQEDTEDEIEEITVIDEVTEAVEEDIPTGDLKPKELRAIIMGYIEMINKVKDDQGRAKFNLQELKQVTKIDRASSRSFVWPWPENVSQ